MRLVRSRRLRILDFDIENRPLSYLGSDFTTADVTAIAASFVGERSVHVWALGEHTSEEMLVGFLDLYQESDIVTGHYIRRHDLPIVNGALVEFGLGRLEPRLVSDTKTDLRKTSGISLSQESLSDMLGIRAPKIHMNQPAWREANRLTDAGIALTKKRVIGDVRQHKLLRRELLRRDMLNPPRTWKP